MSKIVTFEFPDEADAEHFLGWWLDGGGEFQWMEEREKDDMTSLAWTAEDPMNVVVYEKSEETP